MAIQIDTDSKVQGEINDGFGQQHIVKTAAGRLYATHITDINDVEVHFSDDDGSTWTLDTTFSGLSGIRHLSMTKSEIDDIFLFIMTGTGSPTTFLVKKRDSGLGTWSEVRSESDTGQGGSLLFGMITYNRFINRLHLVWSFQGSNQVLRSIFSDDKGSTWSGITTVSTSTFGGSTSFWGLDSNPVNGNLHVFYKTGGNTLVKVLDFGGVVISSRSIPDLGTVLGGGLVVDSSGNEFVIWYMETSGGIFELRVEKNGVNILQDTSFLFTQDNIKRGMMAVGIDGGDNIFIFYTREDTNGKLHFKKFNAPTQTFDADQEFTVNEGLRPSIEQHIATGSTKLNVIFYTDTV